MCMAMSWLWFCLIFKTKGSFKYFNSFCTVVLFPQTSDLAIPGITVHPPCRLGHHHGNQDDSGIIGQLGELRTSQVCKGGGGGGIEKNCNIYSGPPLIRTPFLPNNSDLIRGVLWWEGATNIFSNCCQDFVFFVEGCPSLECRLR